MIALAGLAFCPTAVLAQEERCPKGYSNDQCDQWYFQRADKLLTDTVAATIAERSQLTTNVELIKAIKQTSSEAHRKWVAFRDAECKAAVAASVMSARTQKGRYAACLLVQTERRTAELKKYLRATTTPAPAPPIPPASPR